MHQLVDIGKLRLVLRRCQGPWGQHRNDCCKAPWPNLPDMQVSDLSISTLKGLASLLAHMGTFGARIQQHAARTTYQAPGPAGNDQPDFALIALVAVAQKEMPMATD